MGRDRNDSDHGKSFLPLDFIGAVVPKNAVSAEGVVLSVSLEHFFAVGAGQGGELVRIQAGMVGVDFQVTDSLSDLHKDPGLGRRIFER